MDDQIQVHSDIEDIESGECGRVTGPGRKKDNHTFRSETSETLKYTSQKGSSEILQTDDWIERKKNTLMIVASLIATMSFQAGLNPSGGFWQEDSKVSTDTGIASPSPPPQHTAGSSVMADKDPNNYKPYIVSNTVGFIASLSIILLLISGLPLRTKGLMWMLMFIMWIAIFATTITYLAAIGAYSPKRNNYDEVLAFSQLIWMGFLFLLFIIHTIRLIVKAVRKLRQSAAKRSMNDSS